MSRTLVAVILLVVLSSVGINQNSRYADEDLQVVLNSIFFDDFFTPYREHGVLRVESQYDELIEELNEVKRIRASKTLRSKTQKYVSVGEYFRGEDFMRFQFECIDTTQDFILVYSTSFQRSKENNQMELITNVSPFIDTVWVKVR